MKKCLIALALAIFSYGLMTPALSISVSFSAENGGNMASSSAAYNLDRSTSLQESATLGDGQVTKDLTASGSGNNRISISSSANGKSAGSEMESSGDFRTSAFAGASNDGALISQGTAMSGSYGGITYHADSPENKMVISSGFDGEGDLTAGVSAAAGENAAISGNVNALGIDMLDDESMQIIGSGDIAMSMDGLYIMPNGNLGNFGVSATNTKTETVSSSDTSALLKSPAYTADGGNANAYALLGRRWNMKDPQLKLVLKNDAYLTSEGLSASAVQSAITAAANTWDDATNQNLFKDSGLVTLDPTVDADKYNQIDTISWKPYANANCIAYSKSWFSSSKKVDGYNTMYDSDIVFNSNFNWRTDGSKSGIDVQSVALHEMGHMLGLDDIYNKPQFAKDTVQVMHCYTGIKRTLGNGDKNGIWVLYH